MWLFFILHTGYVRHHSCLPFRSIRVHTRYLVGFILLNLKFFLYHCVGLFVFSLFVIVLFVFLRITTSHYSFCDLQISVSSIKRLGNIRYLDIPLCFFLCDVLSYVQNDRYLKKKVYYHCSMWMWLFKYKYAASLTTVLPVLFKYCYKYCYSDSRKVWAVIKAGGLAL